MNSILIARGGGFKAGPDRLDLLRELGAAAAALRVGSLSERAIRSSLELEVIASSVDDALAAYSSLPHQHPDIPPGNGDAYAPKSLRES